MDASAEQRARWAAREQTVAEMLLKAARLLDERALARLAALPGAPPVRPAHTRLFPHLDFEGVRITALAEKLGVTKQAVAPLVAELVSWGMVEQVPDPSDGRARLVRFTAQGAESLHHGLGLLVEVESGIAARIGPERMAGLREGLRAALEVLEEG